MAEYATKNEVQEIVTSAVTKAVDDLSGVISGLAQTMHGELVEIKSDISVLQLDVSDLKKSHEKLLNTLDAFLKRLDDIEIDNHARDAQLARLERWIEQVAAKTGVKLEY